MINLFITRRHNYTVQPFLSTWPNAARGLMRVIAYEDLPLIRSIEPGINIFSDLERLNSAQMHNARRLADLIVSRFHPSLVINHPQGLSRRYELLQTLWQQGINRFRAFPFDYAGEDIRYPVFMRIANDHDGPRTGILHDAQAHRAAKVGLRAKGLDSSRIITTEFCDTRCEDGFYRKFSAFRVGERIVPAHIIVSSNWVAKDTNPEPLCDDERQYLADNPHRDELMNIFNLAGIAYGRIDYSLLAGKIQVWEINTNPWLVMTHERYTAEKRREKQIMVDELSEALIALHRRVQRVVHRAAAVPSRFIPAPNLCVLTHIRRPFVRLRL